MTPSWSTAVLRSLVPLPDDRTLITASNAFQVYVNLWPLAFLGYLVRRPNTRTFRLLLFPLAVISCLRLGFWYKWEDSELNVYNWGLGLTALQCLAKVIDFASVKEGIFKIGETVPGQIETPAIAAKETPGLKANGNGNLNGHIPKHVPSAKRPMSSVLPVALLDSLEVTASLRGIGFTFGKGVIIPPETRPLVKFPFLWATFKTFATHFLILDFLNSVVKSIPDIGSPTGGTIFLPHLSPIPRYAFSTFVHTITGTAFLSGFIMVYSLMTLLAVGLLDHEPSSWPPIVDNPWISQSLHEFWARRWHQILRRTFLILGGYPGKFVAGNPGLLFGAFLASGLFHECSMYTMGRGWESIVPVFFVFQAIAMVLERVWYRVTGKRVGGWYGTLWVYFIIVGCGQPCVDSWHRRGLGGGVVIPQVFSPTRRLLIPSLMWLQSKIMLHSDLRCRLISGITSAPEILHHEIEGNGAFVC